MICPKQTLKRIWNGELPLVKAFWIAGAIPAFVLWLCTTLVGIVYAFEEEAGEIANGPVYLALLLTFATLLYAPVAMVGVWRSSEQYTGEKLFTYAAKGAVIMAAYFYLNIWFAFIG